MKGKPLTRWDAKGAERDKEKTGLVILSQLRDPIKPASYYARKVLTELQSSARAAA